MSLYKYAKKYGRPSKYSVPSWGPTSQSPNKTGWMQQQAQRQVTVVPLPTKKKKGVGAKYVALAKRRGY